MIPKRRHNSSAIIDLFNIRFPICSAQLNKLFCPCVLETVSVGHKSTKKFFKLTDNGFVSLQPSFSIVFDTNFQKCDK